MLPLGLHVARFFLLLPLRLSVFCLSFFLHCSLHVWYRRVSFTPLYCTVVIPACSFFVRARVRFEDTARFYSHTRAAHSRVVVTVSGGDCFSRLPSTPMAATPPHPPPAFCSSCFSPYSAVLAVVSHPVVRTVLRFATATG